MSPLTIQAPTDAQLLTIRHMCDERDLPRPGAVCSKAEASEIIGALSAGTYDPERYRLTYGWLGLDVPTPDDMPFT